ncbi:unnamed protein product, partial [Ascophyllum nodosum]
EILLSFTYCRWVTQAQPVRCPSDNSVRIGRTDTSREKNPTQRMHTACRIVTRGSCCTQELFAEFDGNNCESCRSLEQLVTPLCAAHRGISIDIC